VKASGIMWCNSVCVVYVCKQLFISPPFHASSATLGVRHGESALTSWRGALLVNYVCRAGRAIRSTTMTCRDFIVACTLNTTSSRLQWRRTQRHKNKA